MYKTIYKAVNICVYKIVAIKAYQPVILMTLDVAMTDEPPCRVIPGDKLG